jgi:sec-independent protein translocase protein TatC
VVAFVIAAVVTPPDVISQLALAIPMCVLYEVGILGARWFVKVSKAPEESAVSQESDEAKEPQGSDDPQKPKEPEGPGPTV